jgi:MAF protein
MNRTLILASTSRYRAALLGKLGLPFSTQAPEVDETPLPAESAERLVRRLAEAKARAIGASSAPALVIGSDQVAVCNGRILGKPGTEARAREQLSELSGHEVFFLTGLCLLDTATGDRQIAVDTTRVVFRKLSATEIANYVAREQPVDCAGAFKSEGLGIALFEAIEGKDPNALVGLPLIDLCAMLRNAGVSVLG